MSEPQTSSDDEMSDDGRNGDAEVCCPSAGGKKTAEIG